MKQNGELKNSTVNEYSLEDDLSTYSDSYSRSLNEPEEFWRELAESPRIHWDTPFEKVLDDSNPPFTKWFVGGYLNACYNCVDRHVIAGQGDKVAVIHDSPLTNTIRKVTYKELYDTISRIASGLKKLGVEKGDRVIIYMPLIPETLMAMLATVRIGAVHSVIFGGFAANELCSRIEHAEPKVIIAADCGIEPNKTVHYLDSLNDAIEMSEWKPNCSVIFQRKNLMTSQLRKNDVNWETLLEQNEPCVCQPVEANDPLYLMYTSGTTSAPKGVLRPTGGHLVSLYYTMNTIFGCKPSDVFWCASDLGWTAGHSYICYAPLLFGATSIMYEGKPVRTPDSAQYFRIIDQHRVSVIFSVPTAFRVIRQVDPDAILGRPYNIDSLRAIFVAGELCDVETKNWIAKTFQVPILNHWWQTETGSPVTATCLGFNQSLHQPQFSVGLPFVGYKVEILQPDGSKAAPNELGRVVIKLPLPPGNLSTLFKNDELFSKTYFQKFPGYYDTMDAGYIDDDGYVYITARDDDVINIAGHRISTMAIEDAVLRHPDLVDAVVFGVPDEAKGEVPLCFFIKKSSTAKASTKIGVEIIKMVREVIGPVAAFRLIASVEALPRTRSGKTLRKAMADFARNKQVILPGTIEDASVFTDIRRALQELGYAQTAPEPMFNRTEKERTFDTVRSLNILHESSNGSLANTTKNNI